MANESVSRLGRGCAWTYPLAVGLGVALASPAAKATTTCSVGGLEELLVPGVTVVSATPVAAAATTPAFCDVIGQLNTHGYDAPEGSAGFELMLPANWNNKFLFFGVGGFGGATTPDFSANPVDGQAALGRGYATIITDQGHLAGGSDASFALLATGKPDEAKLADYYFRATHQVTVAGKQLTTGFYGGAIAQSYFDGCSNGGHQALVEATEFPEDFDGIIAGAPLFDYGAFINKVHIDKQLLTASTYIPAALLPVIDAAVNASCGKEDGVDDGLLQNPAACHFDPYSLVCTANATENCLSPGQADTLNQYLTATRNMMGGLVYPGYPVSDLATGSTGPRTNGGADAFQMGFVPPTDFTARQPWGNDGFSPAPFFYQFTDQLMRYIVAQDPLYDTRDFAVSADGFVAFDALRLFRQRTAAGDASKVSAYKRFLNSGRKLIVYHGFSDHALTPFRTINLYQKLAREEGGYGELQRSARLFMVPGMQHCIGGPGPNVFDTLTPLENWVEKDVAPASVVAAHYANNDPAQPFDRTMPLCPYPTEATYDGTGSVNIAASWSCKPNTNLLDIGSNGVQAGANQGR